MKTQQKYDVLLYAGYLLMIVSVVLVMENADWGKYLFCAGGAAYLFYRARFAYRGEDFRLRRLNRMYAFGGILVVATGYLMFISNNAWLVLMLLLALMEIYVSFRADYYQKHQQ
ncbi:MAG: hypothetical protein ILP04_00495 [Bacteroidales bacterium]|nr:hypothetical protein [Bacteroidales bacterium]